MEAVNAMAEIVPCTSCRYCCDDCPQHLDIPLLISLFNEASYGMSFILGMTLGALTDNELPSACIGCGNCTQMCPQQIDIPGVMRKFEDLLKNQVAAR